jgi:hypothetical protein
MNGKNVKAMETEDLSHRVQILLSIELMGLVIRSTFEDDDLSPNSASS